MAKRKCPKNKQQDGVCGCPSFWRRSKATLTPDVKDLSAPGTNTSSVTTVIDSDLHHQKRQKRQKREGSVFLEAGGMGLSRSKSSTHTGGKLMLREHAGQKQNTAQVNTRAQESGWVKREKAKANTLVRSLVNYDLPTRAERLDWDTGEVRRMVGEIA